MGVGYNAQRKRNLYKAGETFKVSRSKIDLFLNCRHCFYLDRVLGVSHPPGFPFNLNSAVDSLLKKEFDFYRAQKQPHPLLIRDAIDAIPYAHPDLEQWRDSLHAGITFHHKTTNLIITGGVDDIWVNEKGELIIVDYKATSKADEVSIDADWQIGYRRQMDVYSWLFKMNGFKVSETGYFVYCNGSRVEEMFNSALKFKISLIPYKISDSWVEETICEIKKLLDSTEVPDSGVGCHYCQFSQARAVALKLKTSG